MSEGKVTARVKIFCLVRGSAIFVGSLRSFDCQLFNDMNPPPIFTTSRLVLRTVTEADLPAIFPLIQDSAVAATTLHIPSPCTKADLQAWFEQHQTAYEQGKCIRWVVNTEEGTLVGMVKLAFRPEFESAEVGYWIGKPYWGRGYATEAARRVLEYGFEVRRLNRIEAHAMVQNGASFRIFDKLGMQPEGYHRQLIKKGGVFTDVRSYSVLRSEWNAVSSLPSDP